VDESALRAETDAQHPAAGVSPHRFAQADDRTATRGTLRREKGMTAPVPPRPSSLCATMVIWAMGHMSGMIWVILPGWILQQSSQAGSAAGLSSWMDRATRPACTEPDARKAGGGH